MASHGQMRDLSIFFSMEIVNGGLSFKKKYIEYSWVGVI